MDSISDDLVETRAEARSGDDSGNCSCDEQGDHGTDDAIPASPYLLSAGAEIAVFRLTIVRFMWFVQRTGIASQTTRF